MPETVILSNNIKRFRKEMQQSQMDFAADCGISTEILSLIERVKTDPKLSTMQKIAAYKGITVAELLTEQPQS